MIGIEEQIELFKLIGQQLKKKIECIAIGGSAMLFYGFKSATKDIDLVFLCKKDMKNFMKILENIGFTRTSINSEKYTNQKHHPILCHRKDIRIDIFCEKVFSFTISQKVLERIKEKHEFENLIIDIISPEDIILLKSVTDRAGDREDVLNIIKKFKINWDIIINESIWQMKNSEKAFPVYLFDFFEELKDQKADIPTDVIKKLRKISEDEILKFLSKKR
jgi:hypothetical protein